MITIRRADDRGHIDHGWLDARHTFSFGDYRDPAHTRFRALRVINEDRIAPGQGFPMHGHADMEIVTYVISGALEHRDSLGNGSVLRAGDLQHMSAGTGVRHSEGNPSADEPVHLYQIWLFPERRGGAPSYREASLAELPPGAWQTIAGPAGQGQQGGALALQQDASIHIAVLEAGQTLTREIADGRHVWVQVVEGGVSVNGEDLQAGDGAALRAERELTLAASPGGRVLVFDLA